MSTLFNEENFLKKLDNVLPTQDSIQSLALWIIHHKIHYEVITKNWFKKLKESTNSRHSLSLFYLANDVIQNCKRKNAKVFQDAFKPYISDGIALIKSDASIKPNIERVINVWKERNVYDKEYLDKLNELVSSVSASASVNVNIVKKSEEVINNQELEIQKLISEFQPKKLCETINQYNALEKDISLKKTAIESSRVLDINLDHIKQYRDKMQCTKFYNEFENSFSKLEDYVKSLEFQINERNALINLLEQSEIFYDAQYKDAKLVVNAYKGFGSKVHLVQKKLDEILDRTTNQMNNSDVKLDNLDMEMSDDDDENDIHMKGLPIPTISGSQSAIRTHLDPRQNRLQQSNSSYVGNLSSPISLSKKKNDPLTPVKDEIEQSATKNPLDFLTKFINKSSVTSNNGNHVSSNINNINNSNTNNNNNGNNNIISSLQRYVCNTANSTFMNSNNSQIATGSAAAAAAAIPKLGSSYNSNPNAYDPREYNYEGYYNDDLYNEEELNHGNIAIKRQRSATNSTTAVSNNIFINPAITTQNNRSVTPTKDELYQNTDIPLPPQYSHFNIHSQTQPIQPHLQLTKPQPPPMISTNNDHMMTGYNPVHPYIPSNTYNPLIQQPQLVSPPITSSTQISPTTPSVPYIPHHGHGASYINPHQPQILQNYQKTINNSNKNSNNININTNELSSNTKHSLNEDSMKRKHSIDNYEHPSNGSNKKHIYNNNQKSYQHIQQ